MSRYLYLTVIYIATFSSTNSHQLTTWKNCSHVLCPWRKSECIHLDYQTKCSDNSILFTNISKVAIFLDYDKFSGRLVINSSNEVGMTFKDARYFWDKLYLVNIIDLSIRNFCDIEKNESDRYSCGATDSRFDSLNINYFSTMNFTTFLTLNSNCFGDVTGNISEKFPKLEELKVEKNFLTSVPPSMGYLLNLEHLSLRENLINKITSDDFKNNTLMTYLDLGENCIENLPKDVFSYLKYLDILLIDNNQLEEIPAGLLSENIHLVRFSVSSNKLKKIPKELFRNNRKLEEVYFDRNKITQVSDDLLLYTKNLKLIYLSNNHIFQLPIDLFKSAYSLQTIYLHENNFTELPTIKLSSSFVIGGVASIYLNNNYITKLNEPISNKIPLVKTLTLSNNCLQFLPEEIEDPPLIYDGKIAIESVTCQNCCIDKFYPRMFRGVYGNLDLSHNYIRKLDMLDLTSLVKFYDINLSHNKIGYVEVRKGYPLVRNNTQENVYSKINLSGNTFNCNCVNIFFMAFVTGLFESYWPLNSDEELTRLTFNVSDVYCYEPEKFKNRQILSLKLNEFTCPVTDGCPQNCTCQNDLYNMRSIIDCSNTSLIEFPYTFPPRMSELSYNFSNNYLRFLPEKNHSIWYRIVELNLKDNKISSVKNLTITSGLLSLNLQYNKLTQFEPELIELLNLKNKRTKISLSGNPWLCNCDLKRVVNILANQKHGVDDEKDLTCIFNENFYKFTDFDVFCKSNDSVLNLALISSLISFVVIVIIASVLTVLYFRFKAEIKYFLFTRGFCLCWVTEEDVDADKEYDAFISYSSLDGEWVKDFLVNGLENEHPNYKLCVHERDWPGGALIVDQIVQSVKKSRRTIIVLTENFLTSEWSKIEFTVAFQQAIEDNVNRVIAVVPNEVPNLDKCDKEFISFVKLTTYIEASKPHFWRKLRCSMPRTQNVLNSNAIFDTEL